MTRDEPRVSQNVSLAPELRERLRRASERTGIPMSRIVAQGLAVRLGELEGVGVVGERRGKKNG